MWDYISLVEVMPRDPHFEFLCIDFVVLLIMLSDHFLEDSVGFCAVNGVQQKVKGWQGCRQLVPTTLLLHLLHYPFDLLNIHANRLSFMHQNCFFEGSVGFCAVNGVREW